MTKVLAPVIFLVLALSFLGLAMGDRMRQGGRFTLSGKIWLRMALIFAVASGYLFWLAL